VIGIDDTHNATVLHQKILYGGGMYHEVGRRRQFGLHGRSIKATVDLRARPPYSRPFRAVQKAELDTGLIGKAAHNAVERIDFANQMAFAEPANRRITGHLAY